MKKIITLVLIMVSVFSVSSFAQDGRERFRSMMKDRLKEELKLEDAVADSVASVQMTYQVKQREIRMNQEWNDEQKQAKVKEMNEDKKKALKKYLNEEQLKRLDDMEEKQRQARQAAGGGRGNN